MMEEQNQDYSFLGRGWAFPVRFDEEQSSVSMVGGIEDIEESLKILLKTLPGQRVTHLEYGCKLRDLIFSPIDRNLSFLIREAVGNAIEKFEPRIELKDVFLNKEEEQEGKIFLELTYIVKLTNSRYNLVYPFSELEANYLTNV